MNELKKTDFFPETREKYAGLVTADIYERYQDTEEDLRHLELIKEIEATINEKSGTASEDDLGEIPFDEEADCKRWEELEKDFERVFDEAKSM